MSRDAGFALLEAMMALIIVCGAILTHLKWLEQANLQHLQLMREASAQRLALDWLARVQLNPHALDLYAHDGLSPASSPKTSSNCEQQICTWTELALWDRAQWHQTLARDLSSAQSKFERIDAARSIWRLTITWPAHGVMHNPACPLRQPCVTLDFSPQ